MIYYFLIAKKIESIQNKLGKNLKLSGNKKKTKNLNPCFKFKLINLL